MDATLPEPVSSGFLEVGEGHRLYYEQVGSPDGTPVVFLHGGPGSGCTPGARLHFDVARHHAVLFDQRAADRSTPHASEEGVHWGSIDMDHHVGDIERLREHLGIERWVVFGVSWGSVLGLTYAERHPDRVTAVVLGAVSTGSAADIDWLTVHANLRLALDDCEFASDAVGAESRIRAAIARVNLPDSALGKRPDQLSGGMRKRAGVARAIVHAPPIILYDEPTTGLDPQNVAAINRSILRIRSEMGATSIVVTHDMNSAYKIADRIVMLYDSHLIADATPDQLRQTQDPIVRSFIDGKHARLEYRGIACDTLARESSFEETTWLLLKGELPSQRELSQFELVNGTDEGQQASILGRVMGSGSASRTTCESSRNLGRRLAFFLTTQGG
jgi:ABC-type multidrug transport system ATPase subunit